MTSSLRKLHLHLVSDSTGETTHQMGRAALAQFKNVQAIEHIWTLVRSEDHLTAIEAAIEKHGGVVLFSIADRNLRQKMEAICHRYDIPSVSVLDHVVHTVSKILGEPEQGVIGGQHRMDRAYFDRMEALDFTIQHDDGQAISTVHNADIIIVGVSRSSKTPTSIYLAHRGYKVANYALVPQVPFPQHCLDGLNIFVVGLTNDPKRLSQVRRTRQMAMQDTKNEEYANIDQITQEVRNARRLFASNKWPVIDVTRRSVEETAVAILQYYTQWQEARPLESQISEPKNEQ